MITVSLGDVDLARTVADGSEDTPIVLDNIAIDWGNEEFLDEYKPTVAKFDVVLFGDPRTFARRLQQKAIWGEKVKIHDGKLVLFYGKIREIYPRLVRIQDGARLWRVTFSCTDIVQDISGYPKGRVFSGWQEVSVNDALKGLAAGLGYGNNFLTPPHGGDKTGVRTATGDGKWIENRHWLQLLYSAPAGYSYSFDPEKAVIRPRPNPTRSVEWGLVDDVRGGGKIPSLTSYVFDDAGALESHGPLMAIDAKKLGVDEIGCTFSPKMTVGRVRVKHYTSSKDKIDESLFYMKGLGTGEMEVKTVSTNNAQTIADKFFESYRLLVARPRHPDVTYQMTDPESEPRESREYWLRTWCDGRALQVKGSELVWFMDPRPLGPDSPPVQGDLLCPIGGKLRYSSRKGWTITQRVIFANSEPLDPLKLSKASFTPNELHRSVTLDDIGKLTEKI